MKKRIKILRNDIVTETVKRYFKKSINKIKYLFHFAIFKSDVFLIIIINKIINLKNIIFFIVPLLIFLIVYYFEKELSMFLSNDDSYKSFTSFALSLGAALIGVIGIVFALIIFTFQVNIEKLPYGLFSSLSKNKKLLSYFGITFFLAILISSLSLIEKSIYSIFVFLILLESLFCVFALLYTIFIHALKLINPEEQLKILIRRIENNLNWWEKRFKFAKPLLQNKQINSNFEFAKKKYFDLNPSYFNSVDEGLYNIDFMIKKNLDIKDYFILDKTLISLVEINEIYIKAKGKTFLEHIPYTNNRNWNDKIINKTLEILRINFSKSLNNKDETSLIYIQGCYIELTKLYLKIPNNSKIHAGVSTQHLIDDIEKLIFLKNPDLLMNSIQNLERLIIYYFNQNITVDTNKIIKTIGLLANISIDTLTNFPITQTAMNALTNITYELIQSQDNISLTLEEINKQVNSITSQIQQQSLDFTYESYSLGNYFGYSNESLINLLINLTNTLLEQNNLSKKEKQIVKNILIYADKSYDLYKDIYLNSLQNGSLNNFSFLRFIVKFSDLLLFLSSLDFEKNMLRDESKYYLSIISFIPSTKQSIMTANLADTVESLFISSKNNIENKFIYTIPTTIKLLIQYSFKIAKYDDENTYNFILALLGVFYLKLEIGNIYSEKQLLDEINENIINYPIEKENIDFICNHFEKILNGSLKSNSMLGDIEKVIILYDENKIFDLVRKVKELMCKNNCISRD